MKKVENAQGWQHIGEREHYFNGGYPLCGWRKFEESSKTEGRCAHCEGLRAKQIFTHKLQSKLAH